MKKRTLFLALAALLTLAACEKDPQPNNNDNPGGNEEPTVVVKNVFGVADGKKVSIATGNLQYQASTDTWRIAPYAWDARKDDNCRASATFSGWIDCFGWATSGYEGFMPYTSVNSVSAYYHDGDICGTEYDWGVHNAIVNGDKTDPAGTWRTLTYDEMEYIILMRPASTLNNVENARFALATVYGQVGLILFPDVFEMPEGVALPVEHSINNTCPYATNVYTADDWAKLEEAGCVFMPAVGCKNAADNTMIVVDYLGCYWTSTFIGNTDGLMRAAQLWFNPNLVEMGSAGVQFGRSVRLAKDITL